MWEILLMSAPYLAMAALIPLHWVWERRRIKAMVEADYTNKTF